MITTIPVKTETKRVLESIKGGKTWDELLMELFNYYSKKRVLSALEELRKIPSETDEVKLKLELRK